MLQNSAGRLALLALPAVPASLGGPSTVLSFYFAAGEVFAPITTIPGSKSRRPRGRLETVLLFLVASLTPCYVRSMLCYSSMSTPCLEFSRLLAQCLSPSSYLVRKKTLELRDSRAVARCQVGDHPLSSYSVSRLTRSVDGRYVCRCTTHRPMLGL